ncbi:MAG: tRNA (N(6)-L-threonylcarbamoyladenosine(37)-C(2))-methylthiotransferase [Archaeoglobus sp.]|nr:tRNA (N(6)-L-threonylcarbamoyladenosine(37)-C(2))-methylthiotransferase [Archaeoglobus sp.]
MGNSGTSSETKPKIYIETYGCTSNQADSDIIRGLAKRYFALSDFESCDIAIINSCGVIEHTERKVLRRLQEIKKLGKRVILAGCLPRISPSVDGISDGVLTPDNLNALPEIVKAIMAGEKADVRKRNKLDKSELRCFKERLRENSIAIVSISEGCVGKCSYCATRFARGRLFSFKLENIVEEVKEAVEDGFKEIQLTSQDTAAYGLDNGRNLAELLDKISEVEGEFRVRVGMMNPNNALKILDELVEAFKSEKIYKFLHLPVQSGDNEILEKMMREYTVEEFLEVVKRFRREFSDLVFSTDIIVGFPGEDEDSFLKSYELIEKIKPDIVNITRFSARKGTPAAKLKDMPDWIKKERSRKLTELAKKMGEKNNSKHLGKRYRVLVTKAGKKGYLSRTDSYRPVILDEARLGEFYEVKIVDYTFNYLRGVIC